MTESPESIPPKAVPKLPLLWALLALLAASVAVVAGFGTRLGLWHFRTGFAILKWSAYGGGIVAILSFASVLSGVRSRNYSGIFLSACGLLIGLLVAGTVWNWQRIAWEVPPIHDITTDTVNPPPFVAILPLRKDAPNPAAYGGAEIAAKQKAAYPDVTTLVLDIPADKAFEAALAAARGMGWKVVATEPKEGRIEATDTTFWFGFKDDVVVRIAPAGNRSLVDVRSVSRVGRSDVGTNARRILSYLAKLKGHG